MIIENKKFTIEVANKIAKEWYGENWPVVYILNDKNEAYIGETTSITNRMKQHLKLKERQNLTTINIIYHGEFNKSAVLDIESKLIEYMSADNKFNILNSNSGLRNHNYFEKEKFERIFEIIWKELKRKDVVKQELELLVNSDIFKYTPYKRLTEEQYSVVYDIIVDILIMVQKKQKSVTIVSGEAGTGKTILAMYLMKLFADNRIVDFISKEDEEMAKRFIQAQRELENFKIGLVVPMKSLRGTLKKVMKNIDGLNPKMIIGPHDVVKEKYDLLIVDEAHRLYRRTALTGFGSYDKVNQALDFDKESTQLDWIIASSQHQIFFYDNLQSVRPSDIREDDFLKLRKLPNFGQYYISSQLRVKGGNDYLKYIKDIFSDYPPREKLIFNEYEFKLFNSIFEMKKNIIENNEQLGLCRLIAGYAWKWETKGYTYEKAKEEGIYDIDIEGEEFIWNTVDSGWVISKNSANEVGSIHTIQGYDLNYAGVIIGNDIYFDEKTQRIEINKDNYYDRKGKQSLESIEELRDYIINIYIVLLSRAIKGTYIYVCDGRLKKYLSQYIDII